MASFTQNIQPTNDPTYLGLAKETDRPSPLPGSSKGAAFIEGLTKIGDAGIKATDALFKEKISDTLRTGIDQIQGEEFGVNQAAANAESGIPPSQIKGDSGSPLNIMNPESVSGAGGGKTAKGAPAGVTKLGETMQDLTDSYNAGKLSQSYYYGKMTALTKQVSSQFPGYKEDVIQTATSMLGTNPANALRKSLLDDLDAHARATQASTSKDDAFVRSKIDEFGAVEGPAMYAAYKSGKINIDQFITSYARTKGVKNDIELARAKLSLDSLKEAAVKSASETQMGTLFAAKVNNSLTNSLDATGKSLATLQSDITSGKKFSEVERQDAVRTHTAIDQSMRADLLQEAAKPDPRTGQSFLSIHGREAVNKQIDAAMSPVSFISDALTNDKRGFSNWAAANLKARGEERAVAMIDADKTERLANVQAMKSAGFDGYMNSILAANPTAFPALVQAVNGSFAFKMAAGKISSLNSAVSGVQANTTMTPTEQVQTTFAHIQTSAQMITDPLAKPENIRTAGNALFSPANAGFLNKFSPADQPQVFARLASPEIAAKIKASGDPQLWNSFQSWSNNAFAGIYRKAVSDLQQGVVEKDWYTVTYNDKNHQYEATPRPERVEQIRHLNNGKGRPSDSVLPSVADPLNRINAGLRVITPILSADGRDPKPIIRETLASMGYDPARAPEKNTSDLKKVLNQ